MDHVGRIFRPPSEAQSLLLQISLGCSHNKCTYCAMYDLEEQRFRIRPFDAVAADIEEAALMNTKDFRIRHLSHTGPKGETPEAQLQVPVGAIADKAAAPIVPIFTVNQWNEIDTIVMSAPRIQFTFTAAAADVEMWVATKAA